MPPGGESGWERELQARLRAIFAQEAAERLGALDAALLALEGGGGGSDETHQLTEAFRQAHTLKGGARAAGLPDVERVAHALESTFDGIRRAGPAGPGPWGAIFAAVDALRSLVAGRTADVDHVVAALEAPAASVEPAAPGATLPPANAPVLRRAGDPAAVGEAVRVPMARLERLMADVRELHAGLAGLRLRRGRDADVRRLEQATADLGDTVRRLRMVPVGVALAGLPRLVRDTAAACGKEARLALTGDEAEVDRSVLEGISGAVAHLVRNAVDHGLEEPRRRAAAGKPPVGVVTVAAREERGTLVLDVADDGDGIDLDAVRRRAVELGLVPAEEAAAAGFELLFRAGFSTAGRVTEVSGRGVGLDAVTAIVDGLQGSVTVCTEPGDGTTFTVTLPLTVATTRSLLLRAGGRTLALPMAAVGRVERAGRGGAGGPDLAALLGFADAGRSPEHPGLAVVPAGGGTTAVLVDEVRGEEEIVVGSLPPPLRRVRFTAGATILGTGEVVPVLHAAEVFRAAAAPARKVVVVADDSAAARTLAQAVLESAGYDVRLASDGSEALALVEAGGCEAVVTDVQMPLVDGFTVCRRLRADPRFRDLPVVLVTSLGSPADRRRGLAAGADAYLVKGQGDRETLLTTLRGLL